MSTVLICLALAALAVFGVRSFSKRLSGGCCGTGSESVRRVRVQDRDKKHYPYETRLAVGGMTCRNCARRVENALNSLDGVWARVDLSKNEAFVRLKSPPDEDALRAAVQKAGYWVPGPAAPRREP